MIMNDETQRTWKEVVISYFKVLSQHLPGGAEGILNLYAKSQTQVFQIKQEC
jgi:hypothetical protein